ncbi:hypothetical protein ACIRBY_38265 [Streptomyces sp. NPDC096136]|uniref:hypothetical protein n=1 Tax=Streptomyces sp. NPDC096136 TaxID=3366076 RepID=UPI0037FE92CC
MAALSEVGRFMLAGDPTHPPPALRADTTAAALRATGTPAPPLDAAYFDRLIGHLTRTGTLPSPL